jgi:D-inositol-3-phosphate glycosyltransferase
VVADGVSGLLVPGHRADDWAAAVARVTNSPGIRGRLAAGARPQAEKFGWEATTAQTLRTYSTVLEEHHRTTAADERRWA